MNNMYDVLESCLQSMENGVDVEYILAQYPQFANELRQILKASAQARKMAGEWPASDTRRRGRAKLLHRAAQMREAKAPSRRRVMPLFQRLAFSLSITSALLLSGTGLVGASSTALPGENLYTVKRSWEGVQLLFVFNPVHRDALESEFENERLHEVSELLTEGKHELIQFTGILTEVDGVTYISGIRIVIKDTTQLPAEPLQNGAAVVITGHTEPDGSVDADVIVLAPAGSIVPVGKHVKEVDTENETPMPMATSGGNIATPSGDGMDGNTHLDNMNIRPESIHESYQVKGTVDSIDGNMIVIDGRAIYIDQTGLKGDFAVGSKVKVEGYFTKNGNFVVTKIEVEKPELENNDGMDKNNDNGGANSGSDDGIDGGGTEGGGDHSGDGGTEGGGDHSGDGGTEGGGDYSDSGGGG